MASLPLSSLWVYSGIPNTMHFQNVTKIEAAKSLWDRLQSEKVNYKLNQLSLNCAVVVGGIFSYALFVSNSLCVCVCVLFYLVNMVGVYAMCKQTEAMFSHADEEEFEDSQGNVVNKKTYVAQWIVVMVDDNFHDDDICR